MYIDMGMDMDVNMVNKKYKRYNITSACHDNRLVWVSDDGRCVITVAVVVFTLSMFGSDE